MPRDECLITSRVAGPCASCRQPAWPAHVQGLLIYCEACCGCGRRGAQAPGRDAALRGKTFLRLNVSAHNFVKQWRFT
jgi:hypothetical protein